MKARASQRAIAWLLVVGSVLSGCGAEQGDEGLATDAVSGVGTASAAILAGYPSGKGRRDGAWSAARFNTPWGMVMDPGGTLYVADSGNGVIRTVSASGYAQVFAGQAGVRGTADGSRLNARFLAPTGIARDLAGNLYVTDRDAHTIRKISAAGVVTTLAGAAGLPGAVDGLGAAARFRAPMGIAVDEAGYLYVADQGNHTIRKMTFAGSVGVAAGLPGLAGSADGFGTGARFNGPQGVTVDQHSGAVYVADTANCTIRRLSEAGNVTTTAGLAGQCATQDGLGSAARFARPTGVVVDATGTTVYVIEQSLAARRTTPGGQVVTLGTVGTVAPLGVALNADGTQLVWTNGDQLVVVSTATGAMVDVLSGQGRNAGAVNGVGTQASFYRPAGLAFDAAGNTYVADQGNHTIRRISALGAVTTFAGVPGVPGTLDGFRTSARFRYPSAVAVDAANNVYVADTGNHTVRKITARGAVSTLAGIAGAAGANDGGIGVSRLNGPAGLGVDGSGNVFVADRGNHTVRRVSPSGAVVTLAGLAGVPGVVDGALTAARFASPTGLAVDAAGTVYVSDSEGHTIRRISSGGVTTIGGSPYAPGSMQDGTSLASRFWNPNAVAVDAAGNVYVSDGENSAIRKLTPSGGSWVTTTVIGTADHAVAANDRLGTPAPALLAFPAGVAVRGGVIHVSVEDAILEAVMP